MPTNTVWLKSDEAGSIPALQEAIDQLESTGEEVVLDFSGVRRIDSRALGAMEKLAGSANGKGARVVLRGVNIAVYKVLKLMRLDTRFAFLT